MQGRLGRRPGRALLVVASTALAIGGSAAVGAAAAPRARTASTPACATRGLVVWMNTVGNGYAGGVVYQLQFTNLSGRTCTLRGWPGVSAVDLRGRRVGQPASRDHSRPVRTVRLRPGATASGSLQVVNAANFPPSSCRPTTAAGLRVYPPNQAASRVIPYPLAACGGQTRTLSVRPVTR